jgi:hypothetical protein
VALSIYYSHWLYGATVFTEQSYTTCGRDFMRWRRSAKRPSGTSLIYGVMRKLSAKPGSKRLVGTSLGIATVLDTFAPGGGDSVVVHTSPLESYRAPRPLTKHYGELLKAALNHRWMIPRAPSRQQAPKSRYKSARSDGGLTVDGATDYVLARVPAVSPDRIQTDFTRFSSEEQRAALLRWMTMKQRLVLFWGDSHVRVLRFAMESIIRNKRMVSRKDGSQRVTIVPLSLRNDGASLSRTDVSMLYQVNDHWCAPEAVSDFSRIVVNFTLHDEASHSTFTETNISNALLRLKNSRIVPPAPWLSLPPCGTHVEYPFCTSVEDPMGREPPFQWVIPPAKRPPDAVVIALGTWMCAMCTTLRQAETVIFPSLLWALKEFLQRGITAIVIGAPFRVLSTEEARKRNHKSPKGYLSAAKAQPAPKWKYWDMRTSNIRLGVVEQLLRQTVVDPLQRRFGGKMVYVPFFDLSMALPEFRMRNDHHFDGVVLFTLADIVATAVTTGSWPNITAAG